MKPLKLINLQPLLELDHLPRMIQSHQRIIPHHHPIRGEAKRVKRDPGPIPDQGQDQDPDPNPEEELDLDQDLQNLQGKGLTKRERRRNEGSRKANPEVQDMKPKKIIMIIPLKLPIMMIS